MRSLIGKGECDLRRGGEVLPRVVYLAVERADVGRRSPFGGGGCSLRDEVLPSMTEEICSFDGGLGESDGED